MNLLPVLALVAAILANSAANILIKKAGMSSAGGLSLYLNVWFIGGLGLFGLNLLAYTYALKTISLSVAYPLLIGGSLLIITWIAHQNSGEVLAPQHYAGIALILLGATLIVR